MKTRRAGRIFELRKKRYEGVIDHCSYTHSLSSCEIKALKKLILDPNQIPKRYLLEHIGRVICLYVLPQVTHLLGGETFIDSSGSGVGQLQVKWTFYSYPCTITTSFGLDRHTSEEFGDGGFILKTH